MWRITRGVRLATSLVELGVRAGGDFGQLPLFHIPSSTPRVACTRPARGQQSRSTSTPAFLSSFKLVWLFAGQIPTYVHALQDE